MKKLFSHNEHLRKGDELYEVIHNNSGEALHIFIKDGEAIVFCCLDDLVSYEYLGENIPRRMYASEEETTELYNPKMFDEALTKISLTEEPFNFEELNDDEKMADGGMMARGGKTRYNEGRAWTLDHNRHNKKENYEVPMASRKRRRLK